MGMERKIEVEETVSHKCYFFTEQFLRPCQSGAHGTSHACHTLDTPLMTRICGNRAWLAGTRSY